MRLTYPDQNALIALGGHGSKTRLPTIAIETAISEYEWVSVGGADRNTLIDKFHLISALPYVDEIVSNDKFFHEIYTY
jgi:hypothetical protein